MSRKKAGHTRVWIASSSPLPLHLQPKFPFWHQDVNHGIYEECCNVNLVQRNRWLTYFSSSMWSTLPSSPYLQVAYLRNSREKYTKGYSPQWLVTWTSDSLIIIIPHACLGLTAYKTIKQYYILFALPATCPALFPHLSGGGILLLLWRHTALARAAPRFQSWAGLSFWGSTPFCRIATAWPPSLPVCLQARDLCLFLKLYNIRIKFIHQVEDLARLQLHLLVLPNYDWVNAGGIDPYLWSNQKMIIITVVI